MKTQETTVRVLSKETKNGNTNGRDWTIEEYTLLEEVEREDGSICETRVKASTSQGVGDLEIGGIYKVVIFITSRETDKDGKKSLWNSFRVTRAEKIGSTTTDTGSPADTVNDDIPFSEPF